LIHFYKRYALHIFSAGALDSANRWTATVLRVQNSWRHWRKERFVFAPIKQLTIWKLS